MADPSDSGYHRPASALIRQRAWITLCLLPLLAALWVAFFQGDETLPEWINSLGDHYLLCATGEESRAADEVLSLSHLSISRLHSWSRRSFVAKSSRIYTLDATQPDSFGRVECLLIKYGRIESTGSRISLESQCSRYDTCSSHDVPNGFTILPAFSDAHGHLLNLGQSILSVDLTGAGSLKECQRRLEAFVRSRPEISPEAWIEGGGWDHTRWSDWARKDEFPTAADLIGSSTILSTRKISLKRIDFHALWLSPMALKVVQAQSHFPASGDAVPGGLVIRNASGEATGVLVDHAMRFALEVVPPWTDEDRETYLSKARDSLLSKGIVGVGDAAASIDDLAFYAARINRLGDLGIRVYAFLSCESSQIQGNEDCYDAAKARMVPLSVNLPHLNSDAATDLTIRTVKLFADGALGSWGAALFHPYSDRPDISGLLTMEEASIPSTVQFWAERGFQVATHAIGDRANALVLDAYEEILRPLSAKKRQDQRARIEHAQILRPEDIGRFTSANDSSIAADSPLSIIASMQPSQYASDEHYLPSRLGSARLHEAFPWRSLLHSGSQVVFGSDFPVEAASVFAGIQAAISRRPLALGSPSEALNRVEAVRAYTSTTAFAQFQEGVLGSLAAGKWADWILVRGDILDETRNVRESKVKATIKGGKVVWANVSGQ